MWYVYIVECADGTYYTGITTDVERRLNEHNYSFKSAKYTRLADRDWETSPHLNWF